MCASTISPPPATTPSTAIGATVSGALAKLSTSPTSRLRILRVAHLLIAGTSLEHVRHHEPCRAVTVYHAIGHPGSHSSRNSEHHHPLLLLYPLVPSPATTVPPFTGDHWKPCATAHMARHLTPCHRHITILAYVAATSSPTWHFFFFLENQFG